MQNQLHISICNNCKKLVLLKKFCSLPSGSNYDDILNSSRLYKEVGGLFAQLEAIDEQRHMLIKGLKRHIKQYRAIILNPQLTDITLSVQNDIYLALDNEEKSGGCVDELQESFHQYTVDLINKIDINQLDNIKYPLRSRSFNNNLTRDEQLKNFIIRHRHTCEFTITALSLALIFLLLSSTSTTLESSSITDTIDTAFAGALLTPQIELLDQLFKPLATRSNTAFFLIIGALLSFVIQSVMRWGVNQMSETYEFSLSKTLIQDLVTTSEKMNQFSCSVVASILRSSPAHQSLSEIADEFEGYCVSYTFERILPKLTNNQFFSMQPIRTTSNENTALNGYSL